MACFSGYTNGNYVYTDCCGITYSGTSIGEVVCIDTSLSYTNITPTTNSCTIECDEGPLEYEFSVTGVCDNAGNGAIEIIPSLGQKPYTLDNTIPGTLSGQTGLGPFTYTGLTGGTYVFRLNDSSGGVNDDIFINVVVPGCICANIDNVSGTTCGSSDGSLQVNVTPTTNPYTYDLYLNGGPIDSATATTTTYQFNALSSGLYYAIVTDFAGATAKTETVVVNESQQLDFGFSNVNESYCLQGQATSTVTGLTGTPPYTYLWSNGQTGSTATGLTSNVYSVTVTDSLGCQRTKQVTITNIEPLGVVSVIPTNGNCFSCDGTLLVTVSGGTSPYTFIGDNGQQATTNQSSYLLTDLCGGSHSILIYDAAGCQVNAVGNVTTTAGFSVVSINVTNAQCNQSGAIEINLVSPQAQIYTYTITDSNGSSQSVTTSNDSQTFVNLPSDTYDISISTNGGCLYTTQKTITNQNNFIVNNIVTDTTCGNRNGSIQMTISSNGSTLNPPFSYFVRDLATNSIVYQNTDTFSTVDTANNLPSGSYQVAVSDNLGCLYRVNTSISQTEPVNFTVYKTDCILGDDGTASVSIYQGEPPFTISWSNGQTGMSVNNLTGGTYNVTVTDSNGCSIQKNFTINCDSKNVECYEVNLICENKFTTSVSKKRNLLAMLSDAYLELSSGYTNCQLVESIFSVEYGFSGSTNPPSGGTISYYTGTTLYDVPTDEQWVNAIKTILSGVTEIVSVDTDINTNDLIIKLECDEKGKFVLKSKIELELSCDQPIPTPTVTPTSTITPTPTITQTPNASPQPTPTPTNTGTPTVTPTNTPTSTSTSVDLTINTTAVTCARGSVSVVKNGTTIYSINKISGSGNINTTNTITVDVGDSIEIFAIASTPTGAACQSITFYTDLSVDVGGSNVIFITSIDNDGHTFTMGPSGETIDIDFLVS